MDISKLKRYILSILLIILLFFALFESNIITKIVLAIILVIYTIICITTLKVKKITSIYKKQVNILLILFSLIYLISFYIMGIFLGFYENTIKLSIWSLINYTIPIATIIISSEIIRFRLMSQKGKFTKITCFISMVLLDLVVYSSSYTITKLEDFLTIIGFVLFSSISCNLLYNYITTRFGYKGIIIYRLITTLYIYIIPICPNMYIYFRTILRMIYPYIIYIILEYMFGKKITTYKKVDKKRNMIFYTIVIIVVALISMLISCQFKYGLIVIGSGSMTGTINKGDATIYEKYKNQEILPGQIIVFKKDNIKIIHRVVKIKTINDQKRYFTKGDANISEDDDYITESSIIGLSKLRIPLIGYPSLWIQKIFS